MTMALLCLPSGVAARNGPHSSRATLPRVGGDHIGGGGGRGDRGGGAQPDPERGSEPEQ